LKDLSWLMRKQHQEASPERSAPCSPEPRILHVIHGLEFDGGIELWLLHLLRQIDRRRYPTDVLVLNKPGGALEDDFRSLGCQILYCPHSKLWATRRRLARILTDAPYDIVHSHVHHFGGFIVRLAARQGVPIRIVHSRNDTRRAERDAGALRRVYARLMRRWISRYATCRVAISVPAAEDLFGAAWQDSCTIVYSGRDFSPFGRSGQGGHVRQSLGIPQDALVLGHVGKFHERKNHTMVIDVAAEVFRRQPRLCLLLVGDGREEGKIRERAHAAGIADRVVFAGARNDVPQLMEHAMDVFVFPSHYEGLGLAVVEAQAAGLPCIIADHLPGEIDVVPALIHRLPLDAGPAIWADTVLQTAREPRIDRKEALRTILASDFNIERSAAKIAEIYEAARARAQRGAQSV
jgi:glycosyltransferase involved in cell wall biosynthesis